MSERLDFQGRISQSIVIIERYTSSFDENDLLFHERNVTYYWDIMNGAPGQERLNFLCAEWEPFIAKYNPSAFVRSWGADCAGWPSGNGFNSAGLFGQLIAAKEISITEIFEMLCEFSRVAENEWARQMIAGLIRNHRICDPSTEKPLVASFNNQREISDMKAKIIDYWESRDGLSEQEQA